MSAQIYIPKPGSQEAALDQQQLYDLGLKHLQDLASRLWTDYNVHDPGITTLELLCYALTDLGYRASFPIQDLLASQDDNAQNMREQFFSAARILPNRPLTLPDYRKVLIDLEGVKNAWLRPSPLTYYADTVNGKLYAQESQPGLKKVQVAGLYDVTIDFMDYLEDVKDPKEREKQKDVIKQKVLETLQENRNLCEDFNPKIIEVLPQEFLLCCEVELDPNAGVDRVTAEILYRVQEYLAPPICNYSLSEMLARRTPDGKPYYTVEEIFDGPQLRCGFIDDEELARAELRTEIRLSDVVHVIMNLDGVQAVRDIIINPAPPQGSKSPPAPPANKWVLPVEPGKKAILDRERSRLVFYQRNMPVGPVADQVAKYYAELSDAAKELDEAATPYDLDIPLGRFREVESYYSMQNHFPALYGLSEAGLSSDADLKRQAVAYQLKAYLLFFDQLMADYFAQLSHIRDLFSTDANKQHTYFGQVVKTFVDYQKIYGVKDFVNAVKAEKEQDRLAQLMTPFLDQDMEDQDRLNKLATDFINKPEGAERHTLAADLLVHLLGNARDSAVEEGELQQLITQVLQGSDVDQALLTGRVLQNKLEGQEVFLDRRNRFLDHLIARFAERFHDYAQIMYSAFRVSPASVIACKCEFLENYDRISSERSLAYNYSPKGDGGQLWDTENVSGLEKRLARLLGMRNYRRRNLANLVYDKNAEVYGSPDGKFRFRLKDQKEPSNLLLSSNLVYDTADQAKTAMQDTIRQALMPGGYDRQPTNDGYYQISVLNAAGDKALARRIGVYFNTLWQLNNAIDELMEYLWANYSDEGLFVVENLLLRPEQPEDKLCIPLQLSGTDDPALDPCSYRLHIILPADSSRFSTMDFRRFAEEVIREETPAHILPKICWIDHDQMAVFEQHYRDWLYLKAGVETDQRQDKLDKFISTLFGLRNVYPTRILHECQPGDTGEKLFILGSTTLGTKK